MAGDTAAGDVCVCGVDDASVLSHAGRVLRAEALSSVAGRLFLLPRQGDTTVRGYLSRRSPKSALRDDENRAPGGHDAATYPYVLSDAKERA